MANQDLMYEAVVAIIEEELQRALVEQKLDYKLSVYQERTFALLDKIDKKGLYAIIKFSQGTINATSVLLPFTIEMITEDKSFNGAYTLLQSFAYDNNYKLVEANNAFYNQTYGTPTMVEEFQKVKGSERAVIQLDGTIDISFSTQIQSIKIDNEEIDFLSAIPTYSASPNSADLQNNNGRVTTILKFATFTISINAVPTISDLFEKIDELAYGNTKINQTFNVEITKTNGKKYNKVMRLIGLVAPQTKGSILVYQLTFGE